MKLFKTVRNQKGFTLIELAIVLVIIGIILGAVLKGQDLIENARYKRLTTEIKQWETATWAYLDRKGYFPGDSDEYGKIDGTIAGDVKTAFGASGLSNAPTTNTLTLGSASFYIFLGNASAKKNVIAVCVIGDCGTAFGNDITYAENVDLSIDGTIDGTAGLVRGLDSVVGANSAAWNINGAGTSYAAWTSASTRGLLYFFDKKP